MYVFPKECKSVDLLCLRIEKNLQLHHFIFHVLFPNCENLWASRGSFFQNKTTRFIIVQCPMTIPRATVLYIRLLDYKRHLKSSGLLHVVHIYMYFLIIYNSRDINIHIAIRPPLYWSFAFIRAQIAKNLIMRKCKVPVITWRQLPLIWGRCAENTLNDWYVDKDVFCLQ